MLSLKSTNQVNVNAAYIVVNSFLLKKKKIDMHEMTHKQNVKSSEGECIQWCYLSDLQLTKRGAAVNVKPVRGWEALLMILQLVLSLYPLFTAKLLILSN